MNITLSQKILAGFVACIVILLTVAFFAVKNSEDYVETNKWVNHTHEVISEFEQILTFTLDMETGERGFIISENQEFLEPYQQARQSIDTHLNRVTELTGDNRQQQENIRQLIAVINAKRSYLDFQIKLQQSNPEEARNNVKLQQGKALQDEVRRFIAKAILLEKDLLVQRNLASESDARNFVRIFVLLLVAILAVLIVVYLIITINLRALRKAELESADKNWLLSGSVDLNEKTRGERSVKDLAQAVIDQLCAYTKAQVGVIYMADNDHLQLNGSYAFSIRKGNANIINYGEGLVGQAAQEKRTIVFSDVPDDYMKVNSGLGSVSPKNIIVFPLVQDGRVKGVIEIGYTREITPLDMDLMNRVGENLAIILEAAQSRTKMQELLEETQRQAEELEAQQEELRQSNEELQEKTSLLEKSEAELKSQQEELQQTNEELEEKANLLETQKDKLENAKIDIEVKASELEVTSKYKSEFLANMSHELRTPLNSILILSQLLAENKNNRLGEKELEFSRNIHSSGTDLLNLIDEILDLSKIEAGKMELDITEITFDEITSDIERLFSEVAKSKGIDFKIIREPDLVSLESDKQRLEQIIKNLLSNAFKFTAKDGQVTFALSTAMSSPSESDSEGTNMCYCFEVSDTGIGIPADKLGIVFEAFQQADGTTKRKYGGTGLGLSISRELAFALGGEIQLESQEGKGSTFRVYLPSKPDIHQVQPQLTKLDTYKTPDWLDHHEVSIKPDDSESTAADDRNTISKGDRIILIVEDDPIFAKILLDFVRERKYRGIVTDQGNAGLSYARHYRPDAIILDMNLPMMDGSEVLRHLKLSPELRHIPVQIISGYDLKKESLELGAFSFIRKPIDQDDLKKTFDDIEDFLSKTLKKLLVIEDDELQNKAIQDLIGNGDVKSVPAFSGKEAIDLLNSEDFDCVVLDLGLPDMTGFDLLEKIKGVEKFQKIPIVVYTGKDLSRQENTRLLKYANAVVLKTANSKERLLDETMLFLHRVESRLSIAKQNIIRKLHRTDEVLKNRNVLLVDDDIRNIYSLTNVLEEEGVNCLSAENGKVALEVLTSNPTIDIILMDIMMPEMDGYEATHTIRKMSQFEKIPIIALTAKAMKGDRDKCLKAGMSDYVTKPVNVEQLLSLMRVWLYK